MHNSQLDFRAGFALTWELMLLAQSNKRRPFLHSIMCSLFPFLTYAIITYFNKALTLVFSICITNPLYSPLVETHALHGELGRQISVKQCVGQ
jgi:hypothetical protein